MEGLQKIKCIKKKRVESLSKETFKEPLVKGVDISKAGCNVNCITGKDNQKLKNQSFAWSHLINKTNINRLVLRRVRTFTSLIERAHARTHRAPTRTIQSGRCRWKQPSCERRVKINAKVWRYLLNISNAIKLREFRNNKTTILQNSSSEKKSERPTVWKKFRCPSTRLTCYQHKSS